MKSLRRFLSAALLTSVLAVATLADDGIIHGDRTQPTPTPLPLTNTTTSDPLSFSATTSGGSGDASNTTDTLVEVSLHLLGEMLAIY
ncbi:MAG: hypothetical protein QOE33_627 [Acidobacteriota bacterium]|nr:hypothetical protein [Acidobacteriota bacterium]